MTSPACFCLYIAQFLFYFFGIEYRGQIIILTKIENYHINRYLFFTYNQPGQISARIYYSIVYR